MKSVNVRQLKNNPSEALRSATEGPVLVLKGDNPNAMLLHLDLENQPDRAEVMLALASALFESGTISLGRAARMAHLSVPELISHLSRLGISAVQPPANSDAGESARDDLETLDEWLASS